MPILPILLKPRFLSVKNSLTKSQHRRSFILLVVMGMVAIPSSAFKMISEFSAVIDSNASLLSVIELILITFFSVQFLSSAIHALQSLYLSQDTELILASPISSKRIYISKYIENIFASSWILILLIFPLCFGLLHERISSWGVLILVFCTLLAICIVSAFGMTTTIILSRLYPARSLKEFFLLAALALVVVLHQYGQSESLFIPKFKDGKFEQAASSIKEWQQKISQKSQAILSYPLKQELTEGSIQSRAETLTFFIAFFCISVLSSYHIFSDFYSPIDVFSRMHNKNRRKRKGWLRIPRWRLGAFLQKDMHLFLRDLAQPVQLILFLAIGGVTLLSLRQTEQFRMVLVGDTAWWEPFIATIVVLCHLLFTVLFCGRFVFPALALEDESEWLLKQSPLSGKEFIRLKYFSLLTLTLAILIPTYLALGFATNISMKSIIEGMCFSVIHILSVTACAIGTGGTLPLFRFEHLGQITSGIGSFIFMLTSLLLIPILIGTSFIFAMFSDATLMKWQIASNADIIFFVTYACLSYIVIRWFLKQAAKRWLL